MASGEELLLAQTRKSESAVHLIFTALVGLGCGRFSFIL